MEWLNEAARIVGIVSAFLALGSIAYAFNNRETIRVLRENNGDLKERVGILEGTEQRLVAELAHKDAEIAKKDAAIDTLQSVVTGEVKLTAIETQLESHHRSAERWWETALDNLGAIRRGIEKS